MAKFEIYHAEIKRVNKPTSKNHGKPYADLKAKEFGVFWGAEECHVTQMLDEAMVPQVEAAIAAKTFPPLFGQHYVAKTPAYQTLKDDGTLGAVKTSMKVFIQHGGIDGINGPKVIPEDEAMRILTDMSEKFKIVPSDNVDAL